MTFLSFFERFIVVFTLLGAVGAGLMAGLLFAFSNFVMRALAQMPADQGADAMKRINVNIVNPLFLLLFMGTALVSLAVLMGAVAPGAGPARAWLVVGAGCYLVGVVGVTAGFNVPLNNGLAALSGSAVEVAWPVYVSRWMRWNHVRTVLAVVASAAWTVGAYRLGSVVVMAL